MQSDGGFVITGASQGIGREIAMSLARRKPASHFFLVSRSEEALKKVEQDLHVIGAQRTTVVPMDFMQASEADFQELRREVVSKSGRIEGLIHNAGIFLKSQMGGPCSVIEDTIIVNLVAPMMLTAAMAPQMAAQGGGTILFVNSTGGIEHTTGNEAYSASKAGLLAYANALRCSLRPSKVGVISVCPGPVWTRSWAGMEEFRDRMMAARGVGEEIVHQLLRSLTGQMVCEQIELRHVSGAI